jgi:hypothetical protein
LGVLLVFTGADGAAFGRERFIIFSADYSEIHYIARNSLAPQLCNFANAQ